MKKILLVYHSLSSNNFAYAGMEKMFVWLGNSLEEQGYDVTFCTIFDSSRCEKYNNNVHSIELCIPYSQSFIKRNLLTFFDATYKIHHLFQKVHYDYVINFGDSAFFVIIIIRLFNEFKLITSERGDPYSNSNMFERLRRKLIKFSDFVVFQTNGAKSYYSLKVQAKSIVIPNPIKVSNEIWQPNKSQRRVVYVGRIDFYQKRLDILIKSFSIVHSIHPNYILDICGSGEIEKLHDLIVEYNLSQSIVLHGAVKNVKKMLLESDVFVLTSDFEGIPNALLEAMSLGMPVVSTDCSPGGAAILINNYINGLIVERGDIKSLANAICFMIEHPDDAIKMGMEARRSMIKFEPERITAMWSSILN